MSTIFKKYIWSEIIVFVISGFYLIGLYLKNIKLNNYHQNLNFVTRSLIVYDPSYPNLIVASGEIVLLIIFIIMLVQKFYFDEVINIFKPNFKDDELYYICFSINIILILILLLMLQEIFTIISVFLTACFMIPYMIWG